MENETQSPPDELVIELRKPVEFTGQVYTEMNLREPTLGEVANAEKAGGGIASDTVLIALVSGIPKPAVEKIGYRDAKKARDYLMGFI